MDAIILFSHGSLLCGAGEALKAQAARLRERGLAPVVEIGYLNYSEPPFADTVARVAEQGATRIVVAPYFLVPGKFVKVDLPRAVQAAQSLYPDVEFVVADAIGYDPRLAGALLDSAHTPFGPERWREDLRRAAQYCRVNPGCPLYDTAACPRNEGIKNREGGEMNNVPSPILFPLSPPSLLVMVHGSPRPIANEDMFRVVEQVKARGVFPIVEVGFMECNEPSIPDAIARCIEQGAKSVIAVPYFLHTGTHVADDLPTLLEEGRERYPDVTFAMGEYLGRSERLTDILQDRIGAVTPLPAL